MKEALEQTTQTTSPPSLLEVLKAPQASELTRKRKVASNLHLLAKRQLGDKAEKTLPCTEDYIETSLMLHVQYNN